MRRQTVTRLWLAFLPLGVVGFGATRLEMIPLWAFPLVAIPLGVVPFEAVPPWDAPLGVPPATYRDSNRHPQRLPERVDGA